MAKGLWNILERCGLAEAVTDNHPETPASMPEPKQSAPAPVIAQNPSPSNGAADPDLIARLDQSAKQTLAKALEKAPTLIVDAWGNTMEPLDAAIPDEATRYNAAIGIISKTHSVQALIADFDNCIGVIEETRRQFANTLESQLDAKVGSKKRAVENYNQQIAETEAKLQELGSKILELKKQRDEAQSGISEEQGKLDLTKNRFENAFNEVKGGLQSQRQKVIQYGGVSS